MNQVYIIGLAFCTILLLLLLAFNLNYKKKKQINKAFIFVIICLLICCVGQLCSLLFSERLGIAPIYFDYFVYIGTCFLPVALLFFGMTFVNTKLQFKKWYLLLFVIPIISLLVLWTNDLHHLFYVKYSQYTAQTVFGPYFYVHSAYTYLLLFLSVFILVKYSIRNSGIFSKQSMLFILGSLVPIVINLLGILGIPMTIYLTPMSFTITTLLFTFAVLKFRFLSITPIALQRIVDRISDGYIVLSEEQNITDFNKTLLDIFKLSANKIRNTNIFSTITTKYLTKSDLEKMKTYIIKSKSSTNTNRFEIKLVNEDRYFNVEINSILSEGNFIGTLILFKDTTQHMLDMQTIQNNQQLLMERERLASLGQLIGGIAHNLKTPIMSISGAAEGLTDLVKEYDSFIGDPEVTNEDHHDIAKDMREWIEKIKTYTAYMSDVITTVKGQAVTLSEEQVVSFDIDELVKRVDILMKHELKNALVVLNVQMNTSSSTTLHGNIVSLVQVINNMISNSIQAYNGVPNKEINFIIDKKENDIILSIQDFAGGLPKEVEEKLFKEMITTKGKNGTGLGLFMSYSTIRAHFNGNITFETEQGKGTTFHIIIPIE